MATRLRFASEDFASASSVEREPSAAGKALVIGDDIGVFLPIVRSFGRAGIAVDVATCGEDYPGLASRYIRTVHCLPPYLSEPEAWVVALAHLAEEEGYDLIFPSSDSSLGLLETASQQIDRRILAIPNQAALESFASKSGTRALAEAHGVDVAQGRSFTVGPDTASELETLPFPLILKPSQPYITGSNDAKTSVLMVRTREELTVGLTALMDREIVVEQFFAGEGVGVSVLARDGEVLSVWQHRRLAQSNETGRSSRRIGQTVDPKLLHDVEKLTKAVSLTGVAMFEFRQNPATGDYILLEVNPRFWGSLPLALASGADFPLLTWQMMTGATVQTGQGAIDLSVQKTSLTAEFDRLSGLFDQASGRLRAIAVLGTLLLQSVLLPRRFDSWASDDSKPHWAELRQILMRCRATLVRRLSR